MLRVLLLALALSCAALGPARADAPARADEFRAFSSKGLPRSEGIEVRVWHPAHWRRVAIDDDMALAELRGPQGRLTGILQIGRGRPRQDMKQLCRPERARTMLQGEQEARVTEALARQREGRPAFEIGYERNDAPTFMRVRSVIVCLKDSQLVVSCGAAGAAKPALAQIEPVCRRVLESLTISEE